MNIEKYLILNKYLLSLFGVIEFKDLQQKLKDTSVGVDSDGRSYFINVIRSFENLQRDKLPEDALIRYDSNIQSYVRKINYKREPVSLKYFQYLTVLFTEIVLDYLKNRKQELLYELNDFLEKYKQEQDIEIIDSFTENDLKKLAFWMATGSGKTLIMHINYHQFFHYRPFAPDNIILITPNEGLSRQHLEELQKSGIPCRLYEGQISALGTLRSESEVLVIEMTKLVEEKKGGGVTLPVDVFEGRNLLFVDEGHKGRRSEEQKWAMLRDRLSEDGFVFEYSATFGQILSEKNKEVLGRYGKSIVFDYSYRYFYLDGYGKDFTVLNVKRTGIGEERFQELMFVANLISFYEQLCIYEENQSVAKEHNIEKPLWIFVGTTVTGKEEESDVVQIVEFIRKVIVDEEWLRKRVEPILAVKSGLKDEDGEDVFKDKFPYLREKEPDLDDLYRKVFGGRGELSIYELKNAEGEFGLKAGEGDYFGVINIGDTRGFQKQLERVGVLVREDAVSPSLFYAIKRENSPLNILMGSKKFIEGWDTWRVSSMGLLNIGKGQGPQIIQLFGRGVRLKGKGMSLKRTEHDGPVRLLETLNIYAIRADYLDRFLEAIRREEVEFETVFIPVKPRHEDKWRSLYTLTNDETKRFEEEILLNLELDERIYLKVDLTPRLSMYQGTERKYSDTEVSIATAEVRTEVREMKIPEEAIDLMDWERIEREIYEFKLLKGYWNLVWTRDTLKNILLSDRCKVLTLPEALEMGLIRDIEHLEEIALLIIKKYIDHYHRKYARLFETKNMRYESLAEQLPLFVFERDEERYGYTVQIDKKKKVLIREIKKLARDIERLINEEDETIPRIYLDRHLYVPILVKNKKIDKISPSGLEESEREFLSGIRDYLRKNKKRFAESEIFVLRNFPKAGVGFFNLSGFYPDFIMWIKGPEKQLMVFIDPKGLEHIKTLDHEKIKLYKEIKDLQTRLGRDEMVLDSYILSITPYEKLIEGQTSPPTKDQYIDNHVLFLKDKDWAERLFRNLDM